MQSWDLKTMDVRAQQPEILSSAGDARAILLQLSAEEELQEHEVHERARIVVIDGEVAVTTPDGEGMSAAAGHLFEFAPHERHTVTARSATRLLIVLSPWPGDGHPGAMSLAEKSEVREKAAQRRP
jgi:hypothetical protein